MARYHCRYRHRNSSLDTWSRSFPLPIILSTMIMMIAKTMKTTTAMMTIRRTSWTGRIQQPRQRKTIQQVCKNRQWGISSSTSSSVSHLFSSLSNNLDPILTYDDEITGNRNSDPIIPYNDNNDNTGKTRNPKKKKLNKKKNKLQDLTKKLYRADRVMSSISSKYSRSQCTTLLLQKRIWIEQVEEDNRRG